MIMSWQIRKVCRVRSKRAMKSLNWWVFIFSKNWINYKCLNLNQAKNKYNLIWLLIFNTHKLLFRIHFLAVNERFHALLKGKYFHFQTRGSTKMSWWILYETIYSYQIRCNMKWLHKIMNFFKELKIMFTLRGISYSHLIVPAGWVGTWVCEHAVRWE